MGRGKRTIVRSLRLPDLWKGRRTSPFNLLSSTLETSVDSLVQLNSSSNSICSSSSVGQPAFNVEHGSSDGVTPSSFPSALHDNDNLRQHSPAFPSPDLTVMVPSSPCRHTTPTAILAPPPRPTPRTYTGPLTPTALPTTHSTNATINVHFLQGVQHPPTSARGPLVGILPEPVLLTPTYMPTHPHEFQNLSTARHSPDAQRPHSDPLDHGTTAGGGADSHHSSHEERIDTRPAQPPSVLDSPSQRTPSSHPSSELSTLRTPLPLAPETLHSVPSPGRRKRSFTLHDYWCPLPPCRCPPASPGGLRHGGALHDGDRDNARIQLCPL